MRSRRYICLLILLCILLCACTASSEPAKADDKSDKPGNKLQQWFGRTKKAPGTSKADTEKVDLNKPLPQTPPNSRPGTPKQEGSGNRPGSSRSRQSTSSSTSTTSIASTTYGDLAFDRLGSALLYLQALGGTSVQREKWIQVFVSYIRDNPSSLELLFTDMTRLLKTLADMEKENHIRPDLSRLNKLLEDIKNFLERHYIPEADDKDGKSKANGQGKEKEQTKEAKEGLAQQKKTSKDSKLCLKNWAQRIRRPKKDDKGKKSEASCEGMGMGMGMGMGNGKETEKDNAETKEDGAQQEKPTKHSKLYSKYFAERISKAIDSYRNKLADECAILTLQCHVSSHDHSMSILQKQDRMLIDQKAALNMQNQMLSALNAGVKGQPRRNSF
ncbi:hypothetical protein FISHEDRAFT_56137 [Fistulina hepatica ATCC 64428]|uniref:Uncharacterized protein n=1 Tax=Fistulina hepatica ATCC 64428 TaxID=1128425 RepID=A0A0D7AJX3_9AGAR|nr:hypothetical protein FISHEDRAFT_56137 [Fistulina hepatica ATCC 64428]